MANGPYLSLIIPAYNEAKRLPRSLHQLGQFCSTLPLCVEVLVVVEKSEDNTLQLAREAACQYPFFEIVENPHHRGKGYAVRCGMLRAQGEILLFMDADLSVPLQEVSRFLRHFEEDPDVDILLGSRKLAQSRILKRQSWLREKGGNLFNWIFRKQVGLDIRDTQCGFKAFRRQAAREIFSRQQLDGFSFDIEVLLLGEKLGYRMKEVPVEWIDSPHSHVRVLRDGLRMFRDAIIVKELVRETLLSPVCKNASSSSSVT